MATYVRGDAVKNATSYELYEVRTGELIDFANPTNIPSGWTKDGNTYKAVNAHYQNIRWSINLEAGVKYLFKYTFAELNGAAQATIRDASNTTLLTIPAKIGEASAEYTPSASGEYSFRICPTTEASTGTLSDASVSVVGANESIVSLTTSNEINFNVSALGLATGDHTFVVKAKADGYEDSDYSNKVTYTVE